MNAPLLGVSALLLDAPAPLGRGTAAGASYTHGAPGAQTAASGGGDDIDWP